ncbi:hypothetical protein TNCV_5001581 [Trichonephila clavipes]|nr:hypothetical protein TNCV_5001581 [Trichonephila clavipes]
MKKLIKDKERMVSELRNFPPCLDTDCPEHSILKSSILEPEFVHSKVKKQSQKRKSEKEDSEGFAFPKKMAKPTTQLKYLNPYKPKITLKNYLRTPNQLIN